LRIRFLLYPSKTFSWPQTADLSAIVSAFVGLTATNR
jgi:hypothetical protein